MSEDRSLDDFVGAGESATADEADEADEAEPDEESKPEANEVAADTADTADTATEDDTRTVDSDDVTPTETDDAPEANESEIDAEEVTIEPPSVTATWVTGGVACERCGTEVERRWVADGDYVCADCKDW